MEAGSSKYPKFIPVKQVYANMAPELSHSLIAFHDLSGWDNTSFIAGHAKKTMWQVLKDHFELLCCLGDVDLTQDNISSAEAFVCSAFNVLDHVHTTNEARFMLFSLVKKPEALPPTSDALKRHTMRVHYQSTVWKRANCWQPNRPSPTDSGLEIWGRQIYSDSDVTSINARKLHGIRELPVQTGCQTLRCTCRKSKVHCIQSCKCSN